MPVDSVLIIVPDSQLPVVKDRMLTSTARIYVCVLENTKRRSTSAHIDTLLCFGARRIDIVDSCQESEWRQC